LDYSKWDSLDDVADSDDEPRAEDLPKAPKPTILIDVISDPN